MSVHTDYYQVLGVQPTATADEIKDAYHAAAKRAHPDAGGSPEAMEALNQAYEVLADPTARAVYDADRAAPPAEVDPEAAHRAEASHAHALQLARRSAWQWLGYSVVASVICALAVPFLVENTSGHPAKTIFILVAFVPVYGLIVSAILINRPSLRLALATLGRRNRHVEALDRIILASLALAALPLAATWALLFYLGFVR